jgi:hypothetical protein
MKNGKTRLQRVQVLASGKYKFVKNTGGAKSSTKKKSSKTTRRTGTVAKKNSVTRAKKILGNYGATGLLEDAAVGFIGSQVFLSMGYPLESALPMARVAQGAAGHALNRRGKGRLAYGLIDLLDVYLIKQGVNLTQGVSLKAWM